jgi:CO/xanthine dehydrogenase FAD-binding subunit
MAIPYEFSYEKPSTLGLVVHLLNEHGKDARLLAGGTDLVNEMKRGFQVPKLLIDIKGIPELTEIKIVANELHIGALVTFCDILNSRLILENANILHEAAGKVASNGIRNRATMVGNICSAVACMDSATPLLVYDASVHTLNINGEKKYPISSWFVDNRKTAIRENEIVTHVTIPLPAGNYAGAFQKMMRYSGEDLAQASVSVLVLTGKEYRIAFGAVGPVPKRMHDIENFLHLKGVSNATLEQAKGMIESAIKLITDVRATWEYRMHMSKVMFERALNSAIERFKKPRLIEN